MTEPRILVFDVETNAIETDSNRASIHVTVAVARWIHNNSDDIGCTCIVPSAQEDDALHSELAPRLDAAEAIVAYNGRGFDLRVLLMAHFANEEGRKRVESWNAKLVDPFEVMRETTRSWVKLDELLEANGLPCKTGSGLDAIKWWEDGEREKVARYCEADVEALRSLLVLQKPLRFPIKVWSNNRKHEVVGWGQLDWHNYLQRWWFRRERKKRMRSS